MFDNPIRNIDPNGDTVRVDPNSSKQFQADYAKARALLHEKGQDKEVSQLEGSTAIYTIKETDETNGYFSQNRDKDGNDIAGGTITWNPNLASENKNGTAMSPTTIINHEFDHAAGYDSDPKAFEERVHTPDANYKNAEEKRVITGSEQRTARALGDIGPNQVTRTDHGFKQVLFTTDPTSNKGTPMMIQINLKPVVIKGTKPPTKVNPKKDQ